jgi:hypothetical protein
MNTIAESTLITLDTREEVQLKLYAPAFDPAFAGCRCGFSIAGAGLNIHGHALGQDSMQALTLALDGLRMEVENCGRPLRVKSTPEDDARFTADELAAIGHGLPTLLHRGHTGPVALAHP